MMLGSNLGQKNSMKIPKIWVVFNNIKRTKPHLAFAFYSVTAVIKMRKKNGDIENKQTKNPCDPCENF
jgi:hypothetical protein